MISGAGNLDITGAAGLIFTGTDTYTGGTLVDSNSSLTLGNGGATGSIVGNININSSSVLQVFHSNAYTLSAPISGPGKLVQKGSGVLTVSGATNSYTGGTAIQAGTLLITNAQALGSGAVTLSTGAELRGGGTFTLTNTVNFASGTTGATLSAKMGSIFTLGNLDTTNTTALCLRQCRQHRHRRPRQQRHRSQ